MSARADLCGGRSAMIVPTATVGKGNKHGRFARAGEAVASQHARGWTLGFCKASLPDRRGGLRCKFSREKCEQRGSNQDKDHNVLGTILPVHPVRDGLRRHDCHRERMGKA